jgi:hypothetical protein
MNHRPKQDKGVTGLHLTDDRVTERFSPIPQLVVRARPNSGGAILGGEPRQWPKHVDAELHGPLRDRPHALIGVRDLSWRARVYLDALRQVELWEVAPLPERCADAF